MDKQLLPPVALSDAEILESLVTLTADIEVENDPISVLRATSGHSSRASRRC